MKFFLPHADSPEQEERVWSSIAGHLGFTPSGRRIQRLVWDQDGERYSAVVGETTSFNDEEVIAILYDESRDLFHVCTPNRGVVRGGSIMAGGHCVVGHTDFDRMPEG